METKIDLSPEELKKHREIAEKATHGIWHINDLDDAGSGYSIWTNNVPVVYAGKDSEECGLIYGIQNEVDAAHIVANSPDFILALIDEIERLRNENAELKKKLEDEDDWNPFIPSDYW